MITEVYHHRIFISFLSGCTSWTFFPCVHCSATTFDVTEKTKTCRLRVSGPAFHSSFFVTTRHNSKLASAISLNLLTLTSGFIRLRLDSPPFEISRKSRGLHPRRHRTAVCGSEWDSVNVPVRRYGTHNNRTVCLNAWHCRLKSAHARHALSSSRLCII